MEQTLKTFLDTHKVESCEKTITHIAQNGGKYHVSMEENEEFLKLYLEHITNSPHKLYLSECIIAGKLFNFMMDIEIKPEFRTEDITNDILLEKVIPDLITDIQGNLSKKFNNYDYTYTSRSPYLIHIYFHNCKVNVKEARELIENIRSDIKNKYPDILWEKALDSGIYSGGRSLRMIGSYAKKETKEGEYDFYREFTNNEYKDITVETLTKCTFRTEEKDKEIVDLLRYDPDYAINEEELDNGNGVISDYIANIRDKFPDNVINIDAVKKFYFPDTSYPCFSIGLKDKYCPFVRREHKRNSSPLYLFINQKGSCLRCFDEECSDKRFPKAIIPLNFYMKQEFYKDQMTNIDYEKAEEVIPDTYILTEEIKDNLQKSLTGTHFDIAQFIIFMYKDRFRVDDCSGRLVWYEFREHRFYGNSNTLGLLISEDLVLYYKLYKKDVCDNKSDLIDKIIVNLKTVSFKNNILTECANLLYNKFPTFLEDMNSNPDLICFTNGVFDTELLEFRNGRTEDNITYSTNTEYYIHDENNTQIKEVYKFLTELFPDKEVRDYQLKKIAVCLSGRNQEYFNIWTGNGSNGKSKLCELIQKTFGDYWNEMQVSLITKTRGSSSNCSPEVIDLKGRRITTIQEPEMKDRLNMGLIKQLTGGDKIPARQLYKRQESIKIQTKLFLCCNTIPTIENSDGGTWRRIKVVEFKSKFVEKPRFDFEFEKDYELEKKIARWGNAFLSILVHFYKKIKEEGIVEPDTVRKYTQDFRKDNDIFTQFLDECIVEDASRHITTPFAEIYSKLLSWCSSKNLSPKIYSKNEVKKYIQDNFGMEKKYMVDGVLKCGYHVIIREEEEEEY
jgi:P4 family phage/plasmid primase-like protien